MNAFTKGDDSFLPRDWSKLPKALSTLESVIHPQNKPIFDLLLQEEEVEYAVLLEKTELNPRQLKRRIDNLVKHQLVHKFDGFSTSTYALEDERLDTVCRCSLNLVRDTLPA